MCEDIIDPRAFAGEAPTQSDKAYGLKCRSSQAKGLRAIGIATLVGSALFGSEPPNILFIYTDDQSTRTVSAYENAYNWVDTPRIDRLAEEGVRFTRANIGSWCMASRASILTGLQQHAVESMRMTGPNPMNVYDPELCQFWPSRFREQGYYTAQIGKWHTGVDSGYGRDWDHQIVWNRPKYPENAPYYYYDQLIEVDGGEPTLMEGYTTDLYTDWAVEFIEGASRGIEKPWFLWLCYGAVHAPFTPAERHLDDYAAVDEPRIRDVYPPREGKPAYARDMAFWEEGEDGQPVEKARLGKVPVGMQDLPGRPLKDWIRQYQQGVLAIDEGVGRLLDALRETGQYEDTLIVFTSDQGFAWGQHGMKSKVAPYHATIAAPLIVRVPDSLAEGNRSRGTVVTEPVTAVDLPVTFFSIAGRSLPWEMHGHDLTPLLRDPGAMWGKPSLLTHTAKQYGSDTNTIPPKSDPRLYHGPGIPWYVLMSQGRYKYIRTLVEGEPEELYDTISDPEELRNLAFDPGYRELLKAYRSTAISELKRTEAGFADSMPRVD